jgi:hypothetical protein
MNRENLIRIFLFTVVFASLTTVPLRPIFASADSTLTGVVSCSACGGIHSRPRTPGLTCTVLCVRHGAHYTFIVADKRYLLTGDQNLLEKVAGGDATLNGHIDGDTFELASIVSKKHSK